MAIQWTTAREFPFSKTCSSSFSTSGSGDFVIAGSSRTVSAQSASASSTITSALTDHKSIELYNSSSSSFSSSAFTTVYLVTTTQTTILNSDGQSETTSQEFTSSSSANFFTSSSTSSTFASTIFLTVNAETTTSYSSSKFFTASTSLQTTQTIWSSVATTLNNTTAPSFVTTTIDNRTFFYTTESSLPTTLSTVTVTGTMFGNLADTIVEAESDELLYVPNADALHEGVFTNNAYSTNRITLSASASAVDLIYVSDSSSVTTTPSSITTSSVSYFTSTQTKITQTVNESPGLAPGTTASKEFIVAAPESTVVSVTLKQIDSSAHYGNIDTRLGVSSFVSSVERTDVLGQASWQETLLLPSLVTDSFSLNNAEFASTCGGATTFQVQKLGARADSATARRISVSVFGSRGIAVGTQSGLVFGSLQHTIGISTAYDGNATGISVPDQAFQLGQTIESDSITYTTTVNAGATTSSTFSGILNVGGSLWKDTLRGGSAYVVGGQLADGETGLIRIPRGAYKDESGLTLWRNGDDQTWTGYIPTRYFEPVSYVITQLGQTVHIVKKHTTEYPGYVSPV